MKLNEIQVGGPNDCPDATTTIGSSEYNCSIPQTYGWVCVKCGRVYSPSTTMCPYCGGNNNVMPYTVGNKTPLPIDDYWKKVTCTSDTFKIHPDDIVYNSIAGGSDYWNNTEKIWSNVLKNISNIKEEF